MEIAPETPWRRHIDQLKSTVFATSPLSLPVLVPDKNQTVQNAVTIQFSDPLKIQLDLCVTPSQNGTRTRGEQLILYIDNSVHVA